MTAVNAPLSSKVIDIVRRMRGRGSKLSAIAAAVGHSSSGVHRYVRDIVSPVNFNAMALRRQVTLARIRQNASSKKSQSNKHPKQLLSCPKQTRMELQRAKNEFAESSSD